MHDGDLSAVERQIGRTPRGALDVSYRCPCGDPAVVTTAPRLDDGTPFPTTYYVTCPRLTSAIGTLEGEGRMREMEGRLAVDDALRGQYLGAHERYLAERRHLGEVPEIDGISAGGMPRRVKCLHVLVGQALANGPGVKCSTPSDRGGSRWHAVSATRRVRKTQPVTRYGAIDCGTNALRLLVADVIDGELREITREMRTVRLGEGVDATGEFAPAALERTFAALDEYAGMIDDLDVSALRIVATSASRDVRNADEMIDGFQRRVGVVPQVIDGLAEARLSYAGAVRGLPDGVGDFPVLVADIGGGSTEFIRGSGPRVDLIESCTSIDIGCVRMTERCLHSDPPTDDEIRDATGVVDAELDRAFRDVSVDSIRGFIGLAGSVTTVAALAHGLASYDAQQIHGSVTTRDQVEEVTDSLLKMSRTQRAALPVMHPGRVDVIGGGALVLRQILSRLPVSCVVASDTDILDGIVYSLAAQSTPHDGEISHNFSM